MGSYVLTLVPMYVPYSYLYPFGFAWAPGPLDPEGGGRGPTRYPAVREVTGSRRPRTSKYQDNEDSLCFFLMELLIRLGQGPGGPSAKIARTKCFFLWNP